MLRRDGSQIVDPFLTGCRLRQVPRPKSARPRKVLTANYFGRLGNVGPAPGAEGSVGVALGVVEPGVVVPGSVGPAPGRVGAAPVGIGRFPGVASGAVPVGFGPPALGAGPPSCGSIIGIMAAIGASSASKAF